MINLHDLLFTKNRDYLVKYNDDQQVKAAQLAGKVIILYFVRLNSDPLESVYILSLVETYTYLLPDHCLEVVLVAYGSEEDIFSISCDSHTSSAEKFEAVFSLMPWTAIPFSDIASRVRLSGRFGFDILRKPSTSFVIDSSGIVLQSDSCDLFDKYGGLGYPFTDERIKFLKAQVAATVQQPSIKSLLASPKRDYVISNTRDKVPVDTLEEKVVALYFFEEGITDNWHTESIKMAYEEFRQNKSSFEVVLIYLYDTISTYDCTSEESFWNTFKTMPWLALPFKDLKCRELERYLGYPFNPLDAKSPTLVIVGPRGRYIEPWGALIIDQFKLSVYPFTREQAAKLDTEKVRELKLEMLWDQNTIFRGKDGRKVSFFDV
uniref:protein-disulfide reductase n=1 Tax=Daucus carota subsp. sativus TaxID=79200 RepID=A0A164UNZ2_DAUCS